MFGVLQKLQGVSFIKLLLFCYLMSQIRCQRRCLYYYVRNSEYVCEVKITGPSFKALCWGYAHPDDNKYNGINAFYVFKITSKLPQLNIEESNIFSLGSLLNQTNFSFTNTSTNFYTCGPELRPLSTGLESRITEEFCISNYDCFTLAPWVLNDSTVTSFEVTEYTQISLLAQPFDKHSNLSEIAIHNNDEILLSSDSFLNLTKLVALNMSSNNLALLPKDLFESMRSLQTLDLSNNNLSSITNGLFNPLFSVSSLNLSHNLIEKIQADSFIGCRNLKIINLAFNNLKALQENIFKATLELRSIDFRGNPIHILANNTFRNLENLRNIYLSKCQLTELNHEIFRDLENLVYVDLSHNEIRVLSQGIFYNQSNLGYLDLSHNKIVWCDGHTFENQRKLVTLLLNNNFLVSLSEETFSYTPYLRTLDLSENNLEMFHDIFVENMEELNVLNLSGNKIKYVELGVSNKVFIRKLNFSRNEIKDFNILWENLVFMENIVFDYNNLTYLKLPTCIQNMKQVNVFFFRHNQISNIGLPYVTGQELARKELMNCFYNGLPKNSVLLSNNPLNCNCELFSLYAYITKQTSVPRKTVLFPDRSDMKCYTPYNLGNTSLISLPEDVFVCPIEENCPPPCSCGIRGSDRRIIVNCSSKGLKEFPNFAPFNTTVLYFQRNKLVALNMLDNAVWGNLTELRLDDNLIESTDIEKFPQSLLELTLTGNQIQYLSPSLQNFISLHGNCSLMIGNNTRKCNCKMKDYKNWLVKNIKSIKDIENLTCEINENGTIRTLALYKTPDSVLCASDISQTDDNRIIIIVVTCILIIGILIAIVFYYKCKKIIIPFLYVHCRSLLLCCYEDEDMDKEKPFDAFVAYSNHDREIVLKLIDELEQKDPHFQLCIHERNWLPGNFISQNIVYSLMSSKRTLIILSESFVSSPWFEIEMRAAFFQMLQDKFNRLLIIVVGKFPDTESMDPDIREILLRKTYLVWGERWFWEKLRYVMPHKAGVQSLRHRTPKREKEMIELVESEISATLSQQTSNWML